MQILFQRAISEIMGCLESVEPLGQRGFGAGIPVIDFIESHDCELHRYWCCVGQYPRPTVGNSLGSACQRDGERKERPITEAHFMQDAPHSRALPIKRSSGEKTRLWRAIHRSAQVAHMLILMDGNFGGTGGQFLTFLAGHNEIDQFVTTIRGNQFGFRHQKLLLDLQRNSADLALKSKG